VSNLAVSSYSEVSPVVGEKGNVGSSALVVIPSTDYSGAPLGKGRVVPIASADGYQLIENSSNSCFAASAVSSVNTCLKNNEGLTAAVIINFMRDFMWAFLSAVGVDAAFRTTPTIDFSSMGVFHSEPFAQQLLSQQVWGTLAMIAGVLVVKAVCKARGVAGVDMKELLTYVLAAALAIALWNCGFALGTYIGSAAGVSPMVAGLILAPLFTGVFEGTVQHLVRYVVKLVRDPKALEELKEKPMAAVKELFLNMTIGAIPGAMWQIIFFAAIALAPWQVALLVALSVAICNIACSKLIDKLMKPKSMI